MSSPCRQEQWQSAISSLTRALPLPRAILARAEVRHHRHYHMPLPPNNARAQCYRHLCQWRLAIEDYTSVIDTQRKSLCAIDAERAEALAQVRTAAIMYAHISP